MKLTDADRQHAARLAAEAGLPPTVEDPSVLAKIVNLSPGIPR